MQDASEYYDINDQYDDLNDDDYDQHAADEFLHNIGAAVNDNFDYSAADEQHDNDCARYDDYLDQHNHHVLAGWDHHHDRSTPYDS